MYLPIAEMSVDPFAIVTLGAAVGFLSGLFGVGGGFLVTPLLIFYGIPPAVAVGTQAAQVVALSTSGAAAHFRRNTIDFKMSGYLIAGGALGSLLGVLMFRRLRDTGQIDTVIAVAYVFFLTGVGVLMLAESLAVLLRDPSVKKDVRRRHRRMAWMARLPAPTRFRMSQLYISPVPPIILGFVVGVLAAVMGIGGGFILVPAMIYILQMPTKIVVGTSLFQVVFVASIATVLHAATNQTVDVLLAMLLVIGGVVGAQIGARAAVRLKAEQLRTLLALIVLGVGARLLLDLVLPPDAPYVVEAL